jgi:hypothetical protein
VRPHQCQNLIEKRRNLIRPQLFQATTRLLRQFQFVPVGEVPTQVVQCHAHIELVCRGHGSQTRWECPQGGKKPLVAGLKHMAETLLEGRM